MTNVLPAAAGEHARIKAALARFQRGDDAVPRGVRAVIDESWRRCFSSGLHPHLVPRAVPGSARVPGALPGRSRELHAASDAVMAQARAALGGCGTMMALVNAAGVVLCVDGDDTALADAAGMGMTPGSNWSETARGTNGLGTALYLGDHVQVHGPEHYHPGASSWTCTAAAVRDPVDEAVVGALSVSGPVEAFNPHLTPLVLASSAGVLAALAQREELGRKRLLEHALTLVSRRTTTGLMLFDRRGRLLTSDARARAALAALGVPGTAVAARLQALDVCTDPDLTLTQLPFWLRAEWLEAVMSDDERIGTIVKIPATIHAPPTRSGGLPRYKLRRVIAFIDTRIGEAISLEDLAAVAGVSRFHFHRQFKKSLGSTPHDYILQARIERAKELLIESDLTVGEVSGAVGFVDQSHFSHIFRRFTAMTPRSFRNFMAR
jgi:sigma-54 dependent transcriptional regulator, acetoin dehydrogenase operon transcriptional activator AcoR